MNANDHFSEACHEIWKKGGNPDRLSFDTAECYFNNCKDPYYTANRELKRQIRPKEEEDAPLSRRGIYLGLEGHFRCKCGYETTQSLSWCFHADSCPFPG